MSILSNQFDGYIERSSWIRKMFEAGAKLKQEFGAENVYDFSLGNPDLPPPHAVKEALLEIAENAEAPFSMGYMPNSGYPALREKLAAVVSEEQGVKVEGDDLIVTCGAAGGLNAVMRTVLNPCDEVLAPSPFFVEYGFYTQNHGGGFVPVKSQPRTFALDLEAIEKAVNEKTRIFLVNSPNNPSGAIYTKEELEGLADILRRKSKAHGRPIYLVADEPYRFLAFDGAEVPSILPLYEHSIVVSSFSKNLSLAGARVGYVVANPAMEGKEKLMGGLILANRILGYVNAPAIAQQVLERVLGETVDASIYDSRRKAMAEVLEKTGYSFDMPKGAFYFFPEAPGGDDVAFCAKLQEQRVLAVPGTGFGYPGHFRLTFCVGEEVIRGSEEGFRKAIEGM